MYIDCKSKSDLIKIIVYFNETVNIMRINARKPDGVALWVAL